MFRYAGGLRLWVYLSQVTNDCIQTIVCFPFSVEISKKLLIFLLMLVLIVDFSFKKYCNDNMYRIPVSNDIFKVNDRNKKVWFSFTIIYSLFKYLKCCSKYQNWI